MKLPGVSKTFQHGGHYRTKLPNVLRVMETSASSFRVFSNGEIQTSWIEFGVAFSRQTAPLCTEEYLCRPSAGLNGSGERFHWGLNEGLRPGRVSLGFSCFSSKREIPSQLQLYLGVSMGQEVKPRTGDFFRLPVQDAFSQILMGTLVHRIQPPLDLPRPFQHNKTTCSLTRSVHPRHHYSGQPFETRFV